MRSTFQRGLATYLLDLRLTCLHWSYLLFLVLWSGFIIITYTEDDYRSIQGLFNIVLGFISLIGMFLTGIQASRAQRNRFDLLEVALPSGLEVLLARWLAIISALAGLIIAPLFVLITAPAGRLDLGYVVNNLILTLLSAAFATGLVWLVQTIFGVRRWVYPLFAILWLAGGMLPNVLTQNGLPLPGLNLVNFITMNQSISSSLWGQIANGQLTTMTILFYFGLVLLFAALMFWRITTARFHRRSTVLMTLAAVALAVMVFAGSTYSGQVYAANQQVLDEEQYLENNIDQVVPTAAMPFQVNRYDVTFTLDTTAHLSARIAVTNRSDAPITDLTFSLYHQFEVIDTSAPFTRDRNLLTITLPQALQPGDGTQIEVRYQGNITYLERRLGRPAEPTYFIRPEGVNLACAVLWYPVPGRLLPNHLQYDENFNVTTSCPLDAPAAFRLTVEQSGSMRFASNLHQVDDNTFESEGTIWAQLIGTPGLQTQTDTLMTVITSRQQSERVTPLIDQYYRPAFRALQRFFPEAQHLTVIALDLTPDSWSDWSTFPATQESVVALIEPRQFDFLSADTADEYYEIGAPLIKSLFDGHNNVLTENVAYFLWVHYKTGGDTAQMGPLLQNGLNTGSSFRHFSVPFEERYAIANVLYAVYTAHGETEVIDLLNEMRSQIDILSTMSSEQLTAWIEERVDAD